MRQMSADQFRSDYEYREAKRQNRKEDRNRRDVRRGKRDTWKETE